MGKSVATVPCPTCGRKVAFAPTSRWRPFCSQRCKSHDLGAWAAERYRIAGRALDDDLASGQQSADAPGAEERSEGRRDDAPTRAQR